MKPGEAADQLDRLFRAAWALCGEREQAEDLVSATYGRTLVQPPALRRCDDPVRMLRELRSTLAEARREERRSDRQPGAPQPLERVEESTPSADAGSEPRAVYAAVARLPEELRDALVAVDVAGLTGRQAARALRVRERVLRERLGRARAELGRALVPRVE